MRMEDAFRMINAATGIRCLYCSNIVGAEAVPFNNPWFVCKNWMLVVFFAGLAGVAHWLGLTTVAWGVFLAATEVVPKLPVSP